MSIPMCIYADHNEGSLICATGLHVDAQCPGVFTKILLLVAAYVHWEGS